MTKAMKLSAIVLIGVFAVSCSDDERAQEALLERGIDFGPIPEAQRDALADGEVSEGEYVRAFDRFESCLDRAGANLIGVSVDPRSGVISYGSRDLLSPSAPASNPSDRCYQSEFVFIEIVYQTTNEHALEGLREHDRELYKSGIAPCLELNGIVPTFADNGPADFDADVRRASELSLAGKC